MTRVAIYGGAFDPPHVGHVLTVNWLLLTNQVDQVWVMPSYNHPFAKQMAPYEDRFAMCEQAFGIFEGVNVKPDEKQNPTGLMHDLIKGLRDRYPEEFKFYLVIGADHWVQKKKWKKWGNLMKIIEDLIVVGREGSDVMRVINICNVSSTDVRQAIAEPSLYVGEDEIPLTHALPAPVLEYITEERLYECTTKLNELLEEHSI